MEIWEKIWRYGEKMTVEKPRRKTLEKTNPTDTLIWDFQPLELWDKELLLVKLPTLWDFVKEACANKDTHFSPSFPKHIKIEKTCV